MTANPEPIAGPGRQSSIPGLGTIRRLLTLCAFVLVAWLCFPGTYEAPGTGLDPSWMIGLNLFAHQGFRFGHDVIFTYGPLGFLDRPLDIGSHLVVANWARLLVLLGTLGAGAFLLREPRRRVSMWLFLALFPLSIVMSRDLDYELLGLVLLLCSAAVTDRRGWLFIPSAAIAALVPWIKFGTGLCAAATLGVSLVIWLLARGRWREVIVAAGVYLVTLGVLARVLVRSWSGLAGFLHTSWEIARGYNASMMTIGASDSVVAAMIILILIGGIAGWLLWAHRPEIPSLVIGSVSILYAWKHAFVRQDPGHSAILFTVAFWCGLVWLLFAKDWRTRGIWALFLPVPLLCVGFATTAPRVEHRFDDFVELITGRRASRNVHDFLHLAEVRRNLQEEARSNLAPDILPAAWGMLLGQEPVLVLPWEISLCLANHIRCVPYPTLQMYSTYTTMLDRWTARRLREISPRFVIASYGAVDDRNMIWDCPETWATLLQGWEVLHQDQSTGYLLLARRGKSNPWQEHELARVQGKVGAWVPLPPRSGPVRARLLLRERWSGAVSRSLFRAKPVVLQVRTESGRTQAFRLVVETASDGLLVDATPESSADLAGLFNCCTVAERAQAIRVSGPGGPSLQPEFTVVWSEVTTGHGLTVRPPAPISDAPVVAGAPLLAIDELNMRHFDGAKQPIVVDSAVGDPVILTGWAADREARAPAGAVLIRVDGGRLEVPAVYGTARDDVALFLKEPGYARSGYRGIVPLEALGTGRHTLQIRVVSNDGRRSQLSSEVVVDVR